MDESSEIQAPSSTLKKVSVPSSKKEVFAGVGLFLFVGLFMAYLKTPYEWGWKGWLSPLGKFLFAMNFLLPVTGYAIGWIKGFPRWSYPYVGVSLIGGLSLMNASTPGLSFFGYDVFGREHWGWRSWIPLLIATAIALIFSRSFRPVKKFFTNGWNDWTLFTFGMLGWVPWFFDISFDDIDNHYSRYFIISLNIITVLAAYAYMRSSNTWQRVLSLAIGIVFPVVVASIGSTRYWLENGWVDVDITIKISFFVVIVMFSPALIGLLRYASNPVPAEWRL